MTKRVSKLFVFALFLLVANCASVIADDYPAYKGKPCELTMWAWTSNENYAIEEFQKAYPTIKVKWTNVGDGSAEYTKVMTATTAGKGLPDVIMCEYTYAPQMMEYGSFQPINKWVSKNTYLKYYPEVTLKSTSMDGKIYGTPQDSGASIMVYRKDIFDKYNLKVPATWDEFAEQAEKLHKADPSINMLSFPQGWVLGPLGLVWQAGGKLFDYSNGKWYIDFKNPTAKKVFNYWDKLFKSGAVKIDMWWNADWYKELSDGKAATVISGAWFPEWLQLNSAATSGKWRVAKLPAWDATQPQNSEMGGSGFYVSSQSKNPEASALFVLFLNSQKDALKQLHNKSQLPILWSTVFKNQVAPTLDKNNTFFGGQDITSVALEAQSEIKMSYVSLPIMDYVSSSQETELKKYMDGKVTMDQFLDNWQNDVVAFMKKQGYGKNLVVGKLPN
jgi:multiple sugar transport system substrate-binding protein